MQKQNIHEDSECGNAAQAYKQALNKHFYVKKRALFRKGEQLAQFCNSQVFISIFNNETGKIFSFTSNEEFNLEKITQLVLRDVQFGATLNKNKKFLEEDFEKIRTNIKQLNEMQNSPIEPSNKLCPRLQEQAQYQSKLENQIQNIDQRQKSPSSETFQQTQSRSSGNLEQVLRFVEDDDEMLEEKDMFNYREDHPNFNKVQSGLLAMNKAKAQRESNILSRHDSLASHTATVQNDLDQSFQRDPAEMRPQSLFFQDSLTPRPQTDKAIKSSLVDQLFTLDEF